MPSLLKRLAVESGQIDILRAVLFLGENYGSDVITRLSSDEVALKEATSLPSTVVSSLIFRSQILVEGALFSTMDWHKRALLMQLTQRQANLIFSNLPSEAIIAAKMIVMKSIEVIQEHPFFKTLKGWHHIYCFCF